MSSLTQLKLNEIDDELTVLTAEANFIIAKYKHDTLTNEDKKRGSQVKILLRSLIIDKAAWKAIDQLEYI
jgi:hypothetical protein